MINFLSHQLSSFNLGGRAAITQTAQFQAGENDYLDL